MNMNDLQPSATHIYTQPQRDIFLLHNAIPLAIAKVHYQRVDTMVIGI